MKIEKKVSQPKVGRDNKYDSIYRRETRSVKSEEGLMNDIEATLRALFDKPKAKAGDIVDGYEKVAIEIIESAGYEVKKPYCFSDCYEWEGINEKGKPIKGLELLPKRIERLIKSDEWWHKPEGRAAKILEHCHQLRSSMEGGDPYKIALSAMLLQREVEHLKFLPVDGLAQSGARLVNKKYTDETSWLKRYTELKNKTPNISVRKAAETIQEETGAKLESVRTYIYKNK